MSALRFNDLSDDAGLTGEAILAGVSGASVGAAGAPASICACACTRGASDSASVRALSII